MPKRHRDFAPCPPKRQKRYLTSAPRFSNQWKYDVFLSFTGDTRYTFADNVFVALDKAKIYTFKDDRTFARGKPLSSIFKAIERSRFSIIIFSKQYAFSPFCLDEIVKIVECMGLGKHTAFPVFYSVEAEEVRRQETGDFKKAFDKYKHEKIFSEEELQSWSAALERLGCCTPRHEARERYQCDSIEEIVGDILCSLYGTFSIIQQSSLKKGDEPSNEYESIGDVSEKVDQLVEQKQLLNATTPNMYDVVRGIILVMRRLCREKVSVILDDVDNCLKPLHNLDNELGSRSKIIFITRDKHALMNHKFDFGPQKDYTASELSRMSTNIPSLITVKGDQIWLGNRYHVKFEYLDYGSGHCVLSSASISIYDESGIDGAENSNSMVECEIRAIHTHGIEYLILLQDIIFAIGGIDGEGGKVYDNWVRLGYSGSVEPLTKPCLDGSGCRIEEESDGNHDNVEPSSKPSSDDFGYSMEKERAGNPDSVEPITESRVDDPSQNMKMESGGNHDSVKSVTKPSIDDSSHNMEKESGGNHDNIGPITKPNIDDSGYETKKESGGNRDSVEPITESRVDDPSQNMKMESEGNHDSVESITIPSIDDSSHNMEKVSGGNHDNTGPITKPNIDDSGYDTEKESGRNGDIVKPLTKLSVDDSSYSMTKNNGGNSNRNPKKGFFANVMRFFKCLCCFGMKKKSWLCPLVLIGFLFPLLGKYKSMLKIHW